MSERDYSLFTRENEIPEECDTWEPDGTELRRHKPAARRSLSTSVTGATRRLRQRSSRLRKASIASGAVESTDLACLCGHARTDHGNKGKGDCTVAIDRIGHFCRCKTFQGVRPHVHEKQA